MALTYNDLRLRQQRIDWYLDLIRENKKEGLWQLAVDVKDRKTKAATTKAIQSSVLAEALGRELIVVRDIPVNMVSDVRKKWLKEAADRSRNDAAILGTQVHKHAERLAQGEVFDLPNEHMDHVASWRAWVDYYGVEFVDTEFTVFNLTHNYAGAGDFMAYFRKRPDWGLVLGDYKTSKSGIWPSIALQLAAIRYAEFVGRCKTCPHYDNVHPPHDVYPDYDALKGIKTCVGVQITAEGFRTVPVRATRMFFQTFIAANTIVNYKTKGERFALDTESEPFVQVKK